MAASTYGLRAGWNPYSAHTGYGDFQAVQQIDAMLPTLNSSPLASGWNYGNLAGAWGGPQFSMPGGTTPGGTATGNASGFPLLQTPKSPGGNAALDSMLDAIRHLSNTSAQPAFTTTRSPEQATRTATAGTTLDTTNQAGTERLADFTSNFFNAAPEARGYQQQENKAIGEYYAPATDPTSVTASLQRLVNQRRQAVQGSLQRAQNQALRRTNLNRMGMGGNSSYANQQFMDTAAGILANEAAAEAELNRQNYLGVKEGQNRLAGTRAGLLQNYLTRDLIPINAGQQLLTSQLANLGQLGNITNANTITQTPEQLAAARLGLLGQYGQDLNALNIFGVGGNFPSPAAGWQPPRNYSGAGVYNPLLDLPNYSPVINARTGDVDTGYQRPLAQPTQFSSFKSPAGAGYVPNLPEEYNQADAATRAAVLEYYRNAGVYPNMDQNYSPELMAWARQQGQQPSQVGGMNPLLPDWEYEYP